MCVAKLTSITTSGMWACSKLDCSPSSFCEGLSHHHLDKYHYNHQYSFAVNGWVTFVGDAARGVLFPALWPLVQRLGGGRVDQGYLVASFSIGRLVITNLLGVYASKYGHRSALLISQYSLMLGSLLWANAYLLNSLPTLYCAQVLMGLGTGSLGVTRSYVSEQTPPNERTASLAHLTSLQYAGFAVTPLLGSGLIELGRLWSNYWPFALPAYTVFACSLSCAVLLYMCFEDIDYEELARSSSPGTSTGTSSISTISNTPTSTTTSTSTSTRRGW